MVQLVAGMIWDHVVVGSSPAIPILPVRMPMIYSNVLKGRTASLSPEMVNIRNVHFNRLQIKPKFTIGGFPVLIVWLRKNYSWGKPLGE